MKRKAAVAGYFYPRNSEELKAMIGEMVVPDAPKEKAVCVVSPHAGFEYSGPVAGALFSSVELPEIFVVLGPSHRSMHAHFAIMMKGTWETPLGEVMVASDLAEVIMNSSRQIEEDPEAHLHEHSLEVQLPFLLFFRKEISIVPICTPYHCTFSQLEELGSAVASAIKAASKDVLIIASTDMSHYVSREEARRKDFLAIDKILKLDPRGLYDIVKTHDITMCGYQPTTAALVAAKELGARKSELVKYQTSGEVTGNLQEVVGYAGIRIR